MRFVRTMLCTLLHRSHWRVRQASNLDSFGEWKRVQRYCKRCGREWSCVQQFRPRR